MILHSQFNLAIKFRRKGQFAVSDTGYRNACNRCDPLDIK